MKSLATEENITELILKGKFEALLPVFDSALKISEKDFKREFETKTKEETNMPARKFQSMFCQQLIIQYVS